VAYLCAGGSLIGGVCAVILYFVAPNLQNPSDKYKQYYVVKILATKKRKPHRPRRHSITIGEVKHIVGYLTETDTFPNDMKDGSEQSGPPKLMDILWPADQGKWHDTGSLPKDFFSKLVSHSATLVPIEEGHPGLENAPDNIFLANKTVRNEFAKNTTVDLERIWEIREAALPKSRTTSDAQKPKSRTPSDAPKPKGLEPYRSKSRAVSDVSSLDWQRPKKKPAKGLKSSEPTKTKSLLLSPHQPPQERHKKRSLLPRVDTKTTDDAIPEEVWTPVELDLAEPRLRTTSDLTHTNWNRYGKLQSPPPSLTINARATDNKRPSPDISTEILTIPVVTPIIIEPPDSGPSEILKPTTHPVDNPNKLQD